MKNNYNKLLTYLILGLLLLIFNSNKESKKDERHFALIQRIATSLGDLKLLQDETVLVSGSYYPTSIA